MGSVRSIAVTPEAVVAELEINNADLLLPMPVTATVGAGSLLGGDAQVALVSRGTSLPKDAPSPRAANCRPEQQLCDGSSVEGREAASLSSVTETLQDLLAQAQKERVISHAANSLQQIDATAKQFEGLTVQLQDELAKAAPVIRNLEAATANAVAATAHVNNIASSLDNPQTLHELKQTAANAAQLTAKVDAVGGDVAELTGDPEFMKGVRNLTIGLGELFGEIYPAQTAR